MDSTCRTMTFFQVPVTQFFQAASSLARLEVVGRHQGSADCAAGAYSLWM